MPDDSLSPDEVPLITMSASVVFGPVAEPK